MARRMWIRAKDPSTGHEFDTYEDDRRFEDGTLIHVKPKQYPPSYLPRMPKYATKSLTPKRSEAVPEPAGEGLNTSPEGE